MNKTASFSSSENEFISRFSIEIQCIVFCFYWRESMQPSNKVVLRTVNYRFENFGSKKYPNLQASTMT